MSQRIMHSLRYAFFRALPQRRGFYRPGTKLSLAGIVCVAVVASLGTAASMAASLSEIETANAFEFGNVNISLSTSEASSTLIAVDESVARTFTIQNKGEECFIRLKGEFKINDITADASYSADDNPLWIHGQDGFWYYTQALAPGNSVSFTGSVSLAQSAQWQKYVNDAGGATLLECIKTDAIQTAHLTPHWTDPLPWEPTSNDVSNEESTTPPDDKPTTIPDNPTTPEKESEDIR